MTVQNSLELRALTADLESLTSSTAVALTRAELDRKLTIRRTLVDGGDTTTAHEAVDTARRAHENATMLLTEARILLADAVQREKAERDAITRADLNGAILSMQDVASQADDALAAYLGLIGEAMQAERSIRLRAQRELNLPIPSGVVVKEALNRAASHVQAITSGLAPPLRSFAAEFASKAALQIREAAAIHEAAA